MVKAVLPVQVVHHSAVDGLHHHDRGVEVGPFVHLLYNPVHKGAQEVSLAKLYHSLCPLALLRRLFI